MNVAGTDKENEKILKALANRRRIAIIKILKKGKLLSVSAIAEEIKLSFRATSRHLNILTASDILDRDQQGLTVYYRISSGMPALARTVIQAL
jgi:DNA-binding transcriptional ArsR family regulator